MMNGSNSAGFEPGLGFVGVHIGAGQHSESRTPLYLSICAAACARAIDLLRNGADAVEAATEATMVLENSGDTNAGFGSNLTESGSVEMDAGIMDGSNLLFGSVGAMPGIKNPIQVARLILLEQKKGLLPLGRVPPIQLVGEGARDWAIKRGVQSHSCESLVSEKARKLYSHYKRKLDSVKSRSSQVAREEPAVKKARFIDDKSEVDDRVNDTVGVVVLDREGNVASTVSSGGIALKQPGRVGQASGFGAGCWAQNKMKPSGITVGVSTTGCGEHLVRTFFAKECAISIGKSANPLVALKNTVSENFVQSEFLDSVPEKLGGAICLHFDTQSQKGEFLWTHTTASMGLAFQTTNCVRATAKMSRIPPMSKANGNTTTVLVESVNISQRNSINKSLIQNDLLASSEQENHSEVVQTVETALA